MAEDEWDEWRQLEQAERQRLRDLQERQLAAVESSELRRMSAYFHLPQDQQDFRLREESVMIAAKVGMANNLPELFAIADSIAKYIRGNHADV